MKTSEGKVFRRVCFCWYYPKRDGCQPGCCCCTISAGDHDDDMHAGNGERDQKIQSPGGVRAPVVPNVSSGNICGGDLPGENLPQDCVEPLGNGGEDPLQDQMEGSTSGKENNGSKEHG
eukprot:CAMPEP_0202462274 /NCGR_PEP_ID=MMETSP1360-20130828/53317_1 /ASSEMBLY_ACC=CAM_ASM_000848 /TAXON_ID=515479 /ORGANISM="Licmophora paradoxa, Strain CCMP2313" /LENGTH=118 /DNA_ID=CAMNT_0049084681 /DNA_START=382 /DNA_END=738 /DNA_ORIENTATION=-